MPSTKVLCLSDNNVSFGSGYWGEHGVSFYIKSSDGLRILFDTGQSGDVLLHNAGLAGINLSGLDYIVLSHGHYDHAGGLKKVLRMNEGVPLILHPSAFEKKFARKEHGLKDISLPFNQNELEEHCDLRIEPGPVELGKAVSTTGEVERIALYERPEPDLLADYGGTLHPDPMSDDQSLVIRHNGGIILLCGCCHVGIINTMECVKRQHGKYPDFLAGGLHMEKAGADRLSSTVKALKAARVRKVMAGHCSGDAVLTALASAGIKSGRLAAGTSLVEE